MQSIFDAPAPLPVMMWQVAEMSQMIEDEFGITPMVQLQWSDAMREMHIILRMHPEHIAEYVGVTDSSEHDLRMPRVRIHRCVGNSQVDCLRVLLGLYTSFYHDFRAWLDEAVRINDNADLPTRP